MQEFDSLAMRFDGNRLMALDQRLLPKTEQYVYVHDIDTAYDLVHGLGVRGAPLLGYFMAAYAGIRAGLGVSYRTLTEECQRLAKARPTAINLSKAWNIVSEGLTPQNYSPEIVVQRADKYLAEGRALNEAISTNSEKLVRDRGTYMTHCNTGDLVGGGSALSVFKRAAEKGLNIHVYVKETRPWDQGKKLTTWELDRYGVDHTLIVDSAASEIMRTENVDGVFVGADRIALNGDTANKIGTRALAIGAHFDGVLFYVVAPYTTIDVECQTGADIPIEERDGSEIIDDRTPEGTKTRDPYFDVTEADPLITAFVLDRGVVTASQIRELVMLH